MTDSDLWSSVSENSFLSRPPESARALAQLRPHLQVHFAKFLDFLDLLKTNSWAYESLLLSLLKARKASHLPEQDMADISHALVAIDFVDRSVEFLRQIMGELHMDFLTELPELAELPSSEMRCVRVLRGIFLNLSSVSMEFGKRLADTGVLEDLMEDIKHMTHLTAKALEENLLYLYSMGTIHNCCRNPQVVPVLRQLGAVDHITPFLSKGDQTLARAIALMTVSYLVNESQLSLLEMSPGILQYYTDRVQQALAAQKGHNGGWRTEEVLSGLSMLAKNDFNKRLMVAKGLIKPVATVLQSSTRTEEEKQSAVGIVAVLAEDEENARVFQRDRELLKTVSGLQDSKNQKIRDSAVRVLNLVNRHDSVKPSSSNLLEDLLADSFNTLSILDVGEVEFLLEQLNLADKGSCDVTTNISVVDLLRALADLAKDESQRREIFARV
nr:hypothetical protein BaRGS_020112 [Batillaria attramentaria]